jgi:hypothetical protein
MQPLYSLEFSLSTNVSVPTGHHQVLQFAKTVTYIGYRSYFSHVTALFYVNVAVTSRLTLVNPPYTVAHFLLKLTKISLKIFKLNLNFLNV